MKKRFFVLPFALMATLLIAARFAFAHFFENATAGARFFLIAEIVLISLVASSGVILPEISGKPDGKKPFRRAIVIFSVIYILIAALLFIGIPTASLRVDVGYLVLFMISFLYCLNVYLAMLWLHRLPQKPPTISDFMAQILRSLDSLAARTDGLGSNYDTEKTRILQLPQIARTIQETKTTEAAVMEQNIMSKLSAFTAAYENVLAGANPDGKKFSQTLSELESLIQQRTKMK